MKRIVSIFLTAVLLISMLPAGVVKFEFIAKAEDSLGMGDIEVELPEIWEDVEDWSTVFTYTTVNDEATITGVQDKSISGKLNIPEMIDGYPVTAIGSKAFENCGSLTEVTIPDSVKTIGYGAFSYCYGLLYVHLPNGLTTIQDSTFNLCYSLVSIYIPNSVTTVESYAFADCSSLEAVFYAGTSRSWNSIYIGDSNGPLKPDYMMGYLPASVYYLPTDCLHTWSDGNLCDRCGTDKYLSCYGYYSQGGYATLSSVASVIRGKIYLPSELNSYPVMSISGAFYGCRNITEVILPDGVQTIGNNTFRYCSSLEKVFIPCTVTSIGDGAFYDCTALKTVEYDGTEADRATITVGSDNEYLTNATWNCAEAGCIHDFGDDNLCDLCGADTYAGAYTYTVENGEATLTGVNGDIAGNIVLPATLGGYPVTAIGSDAFYCRDQITSVVIPYGVTTIGDAAFYYCGALAEVNLPDSVTNIGNNVFCWCTSLTEITLPPCVTSIKNGTFTQCTALSQVYVYDALLIIEDYAFENCVSLEKMTVLTADGGSEDGSSSSDGPESMTVLVEIPYGVTRIGGNAFSGCTSITAVSLPDTLTSIGSLAFFGCTSLKTVTIPASLTVIEGGMFAGCATLAVVRLPQSITTVWQSAFADCAMLKQVFYGGGKADHAKMVIYHDNDAFVNATWHYALTCEHAYDNACDADCNLCGEVREASHAYEEIVVTPTYLEEGYTLYLCSVCDDAYRDHTAPSLPRETLLAEYLALEYTTAYYKGCPLTPAVFLTYNGEALDAAGELAVTYANNGTVGTALVTVEGVNRFVGTVELTFTIAYESIPTPIVNVTALGEVGKISLSWGKANEINTTSYRIYRKAQGEEDFTLLTTVNGREILTYEDTAVEKDETYFYYVTGVDIYGAEGEPSAETAATVLRDVTAPTVLKITPAAASTVTGAVTLSATVSDNVGAVKVVWAYSVDNGETWVTIGDGADANFRAVFDTTALDVLAVKVQAVACDAEGNASEPKTVAYSLDNEGPEAVTGLSVVALSSKLTLSWNDVQAADASHFILQTETDNGWATVANNITTLGYTVTNLKADTTYTFRVACVDLRGNVGTYSEPFTATTAADVTAPVVTAQNPAPARYNSTIAFNATAKDDCGIQKIEVQVSPDRKSWMTVTSEEYDGYSFSRTLYYAIDTAAYGEGSLFVRAVATDFAGNVSDTGDTAPLTEYVVDRTAPAAPQNVTAVGNDGYITVSWSMGGENDIGRYNVYRAEAADGPYSLIVSALSTVNYHDRNVAADTVYYYAVEVTDSCGNVSARSAAVSATMAKDTQKPQVTHIGATYANKVGPQLHTVSVTATDNNTLACIVVEYATSVSPDYVRLMTVTDIASYYKTFLVELPLDGLADGDNVFLRVYAEDTAGLRSDVVTAKYTVDLTAPTVSAYTAAIDDRTVTLNWIDGGESDLSGFYVYRSTDGVNFTRLGSRAARADGQYTFTDSISATESGTYVYKLEATDGTGNTAAWLRAVEYVYQEPVYVNAVPVARATVPLYMTVGVEERFDASLSTDDIAVTAYFWEFGDGTVSTEQKPVKKYEEAGIYTVKLTVSDTEGATSTVTTTVDVRVRESIGTLRVQVVDETGKALAYVPVYFDLGSPEQTIVTTDAGGVATMRLPDGNHVIGMYTAGYLPVKKETVVLANATRTVTLTTVEEELVTGHFEITRMTFDEIVAAGIDVYDPANQHVYSATVRVTYGSTPLTLNYYRNDSTILSFGVTDSNGKPVDTYVNKSGEKRKITSVTYIGGGSGGTGGSGGGGDTGSDIVAIIDIPASASYLKEFFDVRLHIVNNAASTFVLEDNEVTLNVPDGMTLMDQVSGGYAATNTVKVDAIRGQETKTIAWVLRGDDAGEYHLSADFVGMLAEFNESVSARFETEEAIKVYGLEGIKFRILASDEIHNDALYFQVELENERDIDIYMPNIGLTDKVNNVTASVLGRKDEEDFLVDAYILNAYIQTENGQKSYLAVTEDSHGRTSVGVDVLAPGQKIVYEYVAYNASNYDGIAYFREAVIREFEGMAENIEVGSFHKQLYSFTDYSAKLDDALNGDAQHAYNTIVNGDYYYVGEAEKLWNSVLEDVYETASLVLSGDISYLTQEDQRALIESTILRILSDSSTIKAVEDRLASIYEQDVLKIFGHMENKLVADYGDGEDTSAEIASFIAELVKDSKNFAIVYREKGYEALMEEIEQRMAGYIFAGGVEFTSIVLAKPDSITVSDVFGFGKDVIAGVLTALNESEQDAAYFAFLKLQCNAEISAAVLDALIDATEKDALERLNDAITKGLLQPTMGIYSLSQLDLSEKELLHVVARQMRDDLDKSMEEYSKSLVTALNILKNTGKAAAKVAINTLVKTALGSTPYGLVVAAFTIIDAVFGWGDYVKQQDSLQIYNEITKAMDVALKESVQHRNEDDDFLSMLYLRAICEMRLYGESTFKEFMKGYMLGKYGLMAVSEEKTMAKINRVFDTDYTLMDEWWDDVQYEILYARDLLFNVEYTSELETPRAPVVTPDYETLQTVQTFSSAYEYCFADGVWKSCDNAPIAFTVGVTPSVLRVRKKAGDFNFAGDITTVKIFAQKELSKLITVRFDGVNYSIDGLSADRTYQVYFTNDESAVAQWKTARTVQGSADTVTVSGAGTAQYVILRSCHNALLYETASIPRVITVAHKKPLALTVDGGGAVSQSAASGFYFNGEVIDLLAEPFADSQFVGWFIDGECVSVDRHYVAEMSDTLAITARFTGATVEALTITQLPHKLVYYVGESVDLNGLCVTATYSDDTTKEVTPQAAWFESNVVGQTQLVVAYSGYTARCAATILSNCTHKYDNGCDTHCELCGEVRETEHNVVIDAAVAPTCTEAGLTEGSHCDECGEVLVAQATVAKRGHKFVDNVCTVCGMHRYYTYTVTDGKVTITKVNPALKGDVVIPDTLGGYPVTAIGDNAFRYCRSITTLTIPAGIESIGNFAFKECAALTTVYYNAVNCTAMGIAAYPVFDGCDALETLYIGKDVQSIPAQAFRAAAMKAVYITRNTKVIYKNAFYLCEQLANVYYVGTASDYMAVDVRSFNTAFKEAAFAFETPCFDEHDWKAACDALCDLCGETRVTTHENVVVDVAKAPTCTESGLTEGSHCTVCGNVIVAQETVETTGHVWNEGEVLVPPTADEAGEKKYTCTVCGATKTVDITDASVRDGYYYVGGVKAPNAGLVKVEDVYYYVGADAAVKTGRYAISRLNDLPIEKGIYYFFADGKMNLARGVYDGYYYNEHGRSQAYAGLVAFNGAKYYISDNGKAVVGRYYISKLNGLLPKARAYTFLEDGKMLEDTRVHTDGYYYENGIRVPYAGLVEYEGSYYYVADSGAYVTGRNFISNMNNSGMVKGYYYFHASGKMLTGKRVVYGYYYENGYAPSYVGLVKVNNDYYYVQLNGAVVKNNDRFLVSKTNGLLEKGYYSFDGNGRMIGRVE